MSTSEPTTLTTHCFLLAPDSYYVCALVMNKHTRNLELCKNVGRLSLKQGDLKQATWGFEHAFRITEGEDEDVGMSLGRLYAHQDRHGKVCESVCMLSTSVAHGASTPHQHVL